jgi:hypothetical protein
MPCQTPYRRLRVAEVAARLGFASEAHFSRAFRAKFGHTPSDMRMANSTRAACIKPPSGTTPPPWVCGLAAWAHGLIAGWMVLPRLTLSRKRQGLLHAGCSVCNCTWSPWPLKAFSCLHQEERFPCP